MMFDSELSVRNPSVVDKNREQVLMQIREVDRVYASDAGDFTALHDVTLDLQRGEFVAIVGKSGSGKSTLLNILSGIDRPTSGSVTVASQDITAMSESELARWRGQNVGFVFQFHQLMPTLTIAENVVMPMDFAGLIAKKDRTRRSLELLDLVDIADQAYKFPSELSGGQQQRAAIARSLANNPPLIAADEPTGNLDSQSADVVLGLFRQLSTEGTTIAMVTHERDIATTVDRVICVVDGSVVDSSVVDSGITSA